MKILLLIDSMETGGAETHLELLARELADMGHGVTVASAGGQLCKQLAVRKGINCITLPPFADKINFYTFVRFLCRLRRVRKVLLEILTDWKPDVVHAHTRRTAFIAKNICKRYGIPLVVTAHARFSMKFPKKLLSSWGDTTVAVSSDIKNHLVLNGVPQEKITVIRNGVAVTEKNPFTPNGIGGGKNEENSICQSS